MQKFQQMAKDAQSSGDPILAENYLQHADHYLRRFNELNDKSNNQSNYKTEDFNYLKNKILMIMKQFKLQIKNYLNSEIFISVLILSSSNIFLSSPFNIFPDGSLSF